MNKWVIIPCGEKNINISDSIPSPRKCVNYLFFFYFKVHKSQITPQFLSFSQWLYTLRLSQYSIQLRSSMLKNHQESWQHYSRCFDLYVSQYSYCYSFSYLCVAWEWLRRTTVSNWRMHASSNTSVKRFNMLKYAEIHKMRCLLWLSRRHEL